MKNSIIVIILLFLVNIQCSAQFGMGAAIDKIKKTASDKKAAKEVPDDGITTEIHKNHLNEIVFFGEELTNEEATEDKIKKVFKVGEAIYFRTYLERSKDNTYRKLMREENWSSFRAPKNEFYEYVVLKKDGVGLVHFLNPISLEKDGTRTTEGHNLLHNISYLNKAYGQPEDDIYEIMFLPKLSAYFTPGIHEFEIEIQLKHPERQNVDDYLICEGKFSIEVESSKSAANFFLDKEFVNGFENRDMVLEKEIIDDLSKNDIAIDAGYEKIFAVWDVKNWKHKKNEYGIVEYRHRDTHMLVKLNADKYYDYLAIRGAPGGIMKLKKKMNGDTEDCCCAILNSTNVFQSSVNGSFVDYSLGYQNYRIDFQIPCSLVPFLLEKMNQ